MTICTWIERLMKESSDNDLYERFNKGLELYAQFPSYKNVREPLYSVVMQVKHDYVYKKIME